MVLLFTQYEDQTLSYITIFEYNNILWHFENE